MSTKNLPTLKGVFPTPKGPPKRDFLKENKLKLKDLQKFVNNRQQCAINTLTEQKPVRHRSEVRSPMTPKRANSSCSCASKKTENSITSTKDKLKPIHCDKNIQTDEIDDEDFLSNALKRCFTKSRIDVISQRSDASEYYLSDHQNGNTDFVDNFVPSNDECVNEFPHKTESKKELNNFLSERDRLYTAQSSKESVRQVHEDNVKTKTHRIAGAPDLGNRTELKLPRYLEREKRAREIKKIKEQEKDPNCPTGHYALDETERKDALRTAEKKFHALIDELNRMPMSSETMRTRNRKMEIEKSLAELEYNIRTFSKHKVYIKSED